MDAVQYEAFGLDECVSHANPFNELHYHSLTPCMGSTNRGSQSEKPGLCKNNPDCMNLDKTMEYTRSGWQDTDNYGGVYGIARDGHVIYGPYNADGEIWGCDDHDVCNGFFTATGEYAYASTSTFPYIVGCWGPGPQ